MILFMGTFGYLSVLNMYYVELIIFLFTFNNNKNRSEFFLVYWVSFSAIFGIEFLFIYSIMILGALITKNKGNIIY